MNRIAVVFAALVTTAFTLPAAAVNVGAAAPDFTLTDLAGKPVKLSDYRGKYVVLEWVNPGCPFVQKHYNSGNMPRLQKDAAAQDVVWLAVNSTKETHQDYQTPDELAAWLKEKGAAPRAAALDADGKVAKLYEAKATPHMYVIDPRGTLIYAGAIDDKRSADPEDVKTAHNFVKAALAEARAGKPVTRASTQAYGCSIKY
jgi:peroxiredoxin